MKTMMILTLFMVLTCAVAKDMMVNLASKDPHVLQAVFRTFQHDEDRHYVNAKETRLRMRNFRKFVRKMAKANDEPDGVEYGVTFFADLTEAEAQQYYGFANKTQVEEEEVEVEEGPKLEKNELSWWYSGVDHKNLYNPARRQGGCGSCWAFTTVALLEGMAAKKTRRRYSFSEQQVLDCSGSGNTCAGGWYYDALRYIKSNNHLASGAHYRYDYEAENPRRGSCRRARYRNALPIRITGIYKANGDSEIASRVNSGPVAVAMDFHNINIRGYYSGIWSNTNCRRYPNHAVTLTGYSTNYWEIRNSWGKQWGNSGYLRITRSVQNVCNIAKEAWYITVGTQEKLE